MSTAARKSRLSVARQRPAGIITDYLTVATKPNILNFLNFGLWPSADRLRLEHFWCLGCIDTLYIYALGGLRCTVFEASERGRGTAAVNTRSPLAKAFPGKRRLLFLAKAVFWKKRGLYFLAKASARKTPLFPKQRLCFPDKALFSAAKGLFSPAKAFFPANAVIQRRTPFCRLTLAPTRRSDPGPHLPLAPPRSACAGTREHPAAHCRAPACGV